MNEEDFSKVEFTHDEGKMVVGTIFLIGGIFYGLLSLIS